MLKSLIQLFAETFLKGNKSWVSNQSMPTSENIVFYQPEREQWIHITAPSDGYLYVMARNTIGIDTSAGPIASLSAAYANSLAKVFVPAKKGEVIAYLIHGGTSTDEATVAFVHTVGTT